MHEMFSPDDLYHILSVIAVDAVGLQLKRYFLACCTLFICSRARQVQNVTFVIREFLSSN